MLAGRNLKSDTDPTIEPHTVFMQSTKVVMAACDSAGLVDSDCSGQDPAMAWSYTGLSRKMAETSGPLVSSVVAGAVELAASAVLGLAEADEVCDVAGVSAVVSGSAIWFQDVAGGAAYPTFVNRQMLASRPTMARIDAATMKTLRRRSMVTRRPIRSAASPEERWGRRGLLVL